MNPLNIFKILSWRARDYRDHPYWFRTFGTCIFCGPQGSGKTLSAVQYVRNIRKNYPQCVLVSNVSIADCPFNAELRLNGSEPAIFYLPTQEFIDSHWIVEHSVKDDNFEPVNLEYTGLDMLKYVNNDEFGVLYFIDELHLELNSLESKNIDIEVMVEISQQRKQRKHIVGTSQVFMRLAKPLREQIHDVILCNCIGGLFQFNKWINGETATEENGKLVADVKGRFLWFHSPEMYQQYDTYTKMRRYNKEWQGRKRIDMYNSDKEVIELGFSKRLRS